MDEAVANPGKTIGGFRRQAGLSQTELAKRMGTTQSAVARLESGRQSPSFRTMQKAFRALGHEIELVVRPAVPTGQAALDGVDITQIREARRRSPDERLAYLANAARSLRQLLDAIDPLAEVESPGE